jgi:hypothetical protein
MEFQQEFNRFLKCASNSNYKDIIILGDFNLLSIKWLNGSGFSDLTVESSFTDVLQDSGLFQLIDSPTRGKNVLDLILTINEYLINNMTVTDEESVILKSDHKAITADINIIRKFKKHEKRSVYDYAKGDFNSLRVALRSLPLLDIVDNELDVNNAWTKRKDAFFSAVDYFIPKILIKSSYKPPYIIIPRKLFTI